MQLSLSLLSLAITSVAFAAPRPIADDVVLQPFKSLNKFCKDDSTTAISVGYADGTSTIKSSGTCLPFAGFTDTSLDELVLCQEVICQFSSDNECGVYANSTSGAFDATVDNEEASKAVTARFRELGAGSALCLINSSA